MVRHVRICPGLDEPVAGLDDVALGAGRQFERQLRPDVLRAHGGPLSGAGAWPASEAHFGAQHHRVRRPALRAGLFPRGLQGDCGVL